MNCIKNNMKRYIIYFICTIFILFVGGIYCSYYQIKMNSYNYLNRKISESIKIVIIGDLHNNIFNENNDKLIQNIIEQSPDIIFIIGDMLNRDTENANVVIYLIEQLREVAPVYYGLGNHELDWQKSHEEDLCIQLENAGAVVLDKTWCDIEVGPMSRFSTS